MQQERPPGRARASATAAAVAALALAATADYTVERGDTLSDIAATNGTTVRALADVNGISDHHRIDAGQRLRLPGGAGGGGAGGGGTLHTVAAGEHLTGIAARYGVSVADIGRANGLGDPDRIVAGTELRIPGGGAAAPASAPAPRAHAGPREDVAALLAQTASAHGWNPSFVKAVAWQESGWNNAVVSSAGAVGIMQVLPSTGEFVSRHLAGRPLDLADPADNVLAGVLYLDYLYRITGGDAEATLAGYYQGLRSVEEHGRYPHTDRYIVNVLALRDRFR